MEELVILLYCIIVGLPIAIFYAFAGIVCVLLIVTIPFGIGAFRIAGYFLWPFGRDFERRQPTGLERSVLKGRAAKPGTIIGGISWVISCSWWLALAQIVSGIILCCTIIGLELGLTYFNMIQYTFWPLGFKGKRSRTSVRLSDMW